MLDQRGNILKSVDPDDVRGKREEQFYSKVFSLDEFKSFKKFLPQFYGVVSNQTGNSSCLLLKYLVRTTVNNFVCYVLLCRDPPIPGNQ